MNCINNVSLLWAHVLSLLILEVFKNLYVLLRKRRKLLGECELEFLLTYKYKDSAQNFIWSGLFLGLKRPCLDWEHGLLVSHPIQFIVKGKISMREKNGSQFVRPIRLKYIWSNILFPICQTEPTKMWRNISFFICQTEPTKMWKEHIVRYLSNRAD